jgi:dTDP-4-dehydrorhamnose 3,5-epimerase
VVPTELPDVLLITPKEFGDARGALYVSFNVRDFEAATGLTRTFVQDNHTRSAPGVLRGLHYQIGQPQGKLVRVVRGEIFDVAVDLRRGSPGFGRWTGARLSAENRRQMWVPEGFAHGFLVTSDIDAEVLYKVTDHWAPQLERTLLWNDPAIGIAWPHASPRMAAKDEAGIPLARADVFD